MSGKKGTIFLPFSEDRLSALVDLKCHLGDNAAHLWEGTSKNKNKQSKKRQNGRFLKMLLMELATIKFLNKGANHISKTGLAVSGEQTSTKAVTSVSSRLYLLAPQIAY